MKWEVARERNKKRTLNVFKMSLFMIMKKKRKVDIKNRKKKKRNTKKIKKVF